MSSLSAKTGCNVLVVLCLIGLPVWAHAEDERELLALVQAQHRAAQEAVHSLSCEARLERGYPSTEQVFAGKYWRSLDRARLQEEHEASTGDHYYLIPEGELREVTRYHPVNGHARWRTGRELLDYRPRLLDVWRFMLLQFEDRLAHATATPRVKRETVDGHNCIRVTMTFPGVQARNIPERQFAFWFDVGKNYLVWKRVETCKEFNIEWQVQQWTEPQPGVVFPTKLAGKGYRSGTQYSQGCYTLSNVRINQPIPKSIFEIPGVPSGTPCDDLIRKQSYPIDATWQQLPGSKAAHFDVYGIPYTTPEQGGFTAQSTAEPWDWTWWIGPISLAVLALAGAVWLYRRYRAPALET